MDADKRQIDFVTPHQRKSFSLICNEPDGYYQMDMDKCLAEKDIIMNPQMKLAIDSMMRYLGTGIKHENERKVY